MARSPLYIHAKAFDEFKEINHYFLKWKCKLLLNHPLNGWFICDRIYGTLNSWMCVLFLLHLFRVWPVHRRCGLWRNFVFGIQWRQLRSQKFRHSALYEHNLLSCLNGIKFTIACPRVRFHVISHLHYASACVVCWCDYRHCQLPTGN